MATFQRVLIVEDEQTEAECLAKEFRKYLGQKRPDLDPAPWTADLTDALKRLGHEVFDVVLLDMTFAGSLHEGVRLIKAMRAFGLAKSQPPVVVLSARDQVHICVKAMQAGAADYIVKGKAEQHASERTIDEDTVDRALKACQGAVERARGVPGELLAEWVERHAGELQDRFAGRFAAVFPASASMGELIDDRRVLAFEHREAAINEFVNHLEWFEHEV